MNITCSDKEVKTNQQLLSVISNAIGTISKQSEGAKIKTAQHFDHTKPFRVIVNIKTENQ